MTVDTTVSTWWSDVKAWFLNSETILIARATALGGFLMSAVESVDWSTLTTLGVTDSFQWNKFATIGAVFFAHGVITEIARRRNSTLSTDTPAIAASK